ncbi:recombinase RecT [Arsenicicoccus dermatophilus]|uniref:recombinase RecT n=1 Tax=Arsenicicoccus dermatophilus TaxID=1076331 RepID=UPI001F4C5F11|nr:recombinase RecT [Arsenicicoccus dermatophilus]MCH8613434.1 recombinase RecT [Arsenicicoccus dermatophilus]
MTTITQAVAQREQDQQGPGALIQRYSNDFATVLPTHIKPETWVRLASGALKKGKQDPRTGRFELEIAAMNNPSIFLASLLEAARLGLAPGSAEYYLTPRKVKGQLEILGIVGYQGYIELMYRAGAISSVVVEVVRDSDRFTFRPGRDEIPQHDIDWDAEDRGKLRLVYAYARMKDGAYSKVVVLNRAGIERIKRSSQGAHSEYSPWQQHEEAMWMKSAVRQLRKWVPTSAEYIREQMRAARDVVQESTNLSPELVQVAGEAVHRTTGEILDADVEVEPDLEEPPAGYDASGAGLPAFGGDE